jgi:hypothetical protein
MPRAMVLFLDRSLPHLREEDKVAYATFIEAVAHLGYSVAWLCRSQGMKDEIVNWEDVCDMGRNLHRLLKLRVTWNPQRPENPLDKDIPQSKSSSFATKKTPVGLGEVSYSTSHSFALDGESAQRLGGWDLTPWKLKDQLKSFLYAEEQTKDWDNLDPKEWADMENAIIDDPIMVGKGHREGDGKGSMASRPTSTESAAVEERKMNGWTRVKSRSEEPAKKLAPE